MRAQLSPLFVSALSLVACAGAPVAPPMSVTPHPTPPAARALAGPRPAAEISEIEPPHVAQKAPRAPEDAYVGAHPAAASPGANALRPVRGASAAETLAAANGAARQRPTEAAFEASRQVYAYAPGALYELHANPRYVSTILLEPGETLNDIAAGDTTRWSVTETMTETMRDGGGEGRVVVLVKPQASGLRTNLVLVTDRRTYLIEAASQAGETYAAQIAWSYPAPAPAEAPATTPVARDLYFDYRVRTVRGRTPAWAPTRVFDDGGRTWIEFPRSISAGDMPPLFVITPEGAELANYRVQGARFMLDRLFDVAELRLGVANPVIVRLERRRPTTEAAKLTRERARP